MKSFQSLRKDYLLARHECDRTLTAVLDALVSLEPSSRTATLSEALASQRVVRLLWDQLPEEHLAHQYPSPFETTSQALWCLSGLGNPNVTLHLGWGGLSFATSLSAAWTAWPTFAALTTDTYNSCIYPPTLQWYLIRAGRHLYPMDCRTSERPVLMAPSNTGPTTGSSYAPHA